RVSKPLLIDGVDHIVVLSQSLLPFAADGVGFVEDGGDPLLLRQRRQKNLESLDSWHVDRLVRAPLHFVRKRWPRCLEGFVQKLRQKFWATNPVDKILTGRHVAPENCDVANRGGPAECNSALWKNTG